MIRWDQQLILDGLAFSSRHTLEVRFLEVIVVDCLNIADLWPYHVYFEVSWWGMLTILGYFHRMLRDFFVYVFQWVCHYVIPAKYPQKINVKIAYHLMYRHRTLSHMIPCWTSRLVEMNYHAPTWASSLLVQ
jgi:hypothetical protein